MWIKWYCLPGICRKLGRLAQETAPTMQKNSSSRETDAKGENRIRFAIVIGVFVVATILGAGGVWIAIVQPDRARDTWIIIGPVITAAISGSLGFLAGRRHAGR